QDSRFKLGNINYHAISYASALNDIENIKLLIPYSDLSKCADTKILRIVKQLEEERRAKTPQEISDIFATLMTKHNVNGVFLGEDGKRTIIIGSEVFSC